VRFDVSTDLRLFEESVQAAIGDWQGPLEPELGTWLDDRDAALAERLAGIGWSELWIGGQLEPAVAGALALGRAAAPVCLIDEAALGAALAVDGRVRHGNGAERCAMPLGGFGLALGRPRETGREATLDGTGTIRATVSDLEPLAAADADRRLRLWSAATLGYLAGASARALDETVSYARSREQFGKTLGALPAVQARLADAALAVEGLALVAWSAAVSEGPPVPASALAWSGVACRDVTAAAHQVHGAIGFALETGLHRYYRRAKTIQVWNAALCRACALEPG
jgi:hypothetical protein